MASSMMDSVLAAHPELTEALSYALERVAEDQPSNPVLATAQHLRQFARDRRGAGESGSYDMEAAAAAAVAAAGAGSDHDGLGEGDILVDDDDEEEFARIRSRQRGRRDNVFSEPVELDEDWVPPMVAKSQAARAEIKSALRSNIVFSGLDQDQCQVLVGAMKEAHYPEGSVIIQQGDSGDYYYILSEGSCAIDVNGKKVLDVSPGMGFGELALLYDAPRAATVTATSTVRAWAIDRKSFKQVIVGSTLRKRERFREFLEEVDLLRPLAGEERLSIADHCQQLSLQPGDQAVVEGDAAADRFFIVHSGEFSVTKADREGEVWRRLVPGSYFGELALLFDQPRAATVTAVKQSTVLAMDKASFVRLLEPLHGLLRARAARYQTYEEQKE